MEGLSLGRPRLPEIGERRVDRLERCLVPGPGIFGGLFDREQGGGPEDLAGTDLVLDLRVAERGVL